MTIFWRLPIISDNPQLGFPRRTAVFLVEMLATMAWWSKKLTIFAL